MHLSMWVASSLSTYVIPVLFNKNSSANISRSPFIKLIIYSTRFVIIKTFIKKIFASTEVTFTSRLVELFFLIGGCRCCQNVDLNPKIQDLRLS